MRVLSIDELSDISAMINAWYKKKNMGETYIYGGAQVNVIINAYVMRLGLDMVRRT